MNVVAGWLFIHDGLHWWMAVSVFVSCWMAYALVVIRGHARREAKKRPGHDAGDLDDFTAAEMDALPGRPVRSIRAGGIAAVGFLIVGIVV